MTMEEEPRGIYKPRISGHPQSKEKARSHLRVSQALPTP